MDVALCKNHARKLQETCKKNYSDAIDVFRDFKENVGELCKKELSPVWKIETILDACESEASLTRFSIMANMNLLELTLKPMEERTSSSKLMAYP